MTLAITSTSPGTTNEQNGTTEGPGHNTVISDLDEEERDEDAFFEDQTTPADEFPILVRVPSRYINDSDRNKDSSK